MTFIWPAMLGLLVLVPASVVLYIVWQRRRQQVVARFGHLEFAQGALAQGKSLGRHVPPALFVTGLTTLIVALARPQTVVSLPRTEGTVILAFDDSGSMAADDLKPTRMDAAKAAARDFVQLQPPGVQIGVVAFSDGGFPVQVPTDDKDAVLAAIDRLAPQRGTSLASGILASLKTISAGSEGAPHLYSNATPEPTPSPTPVPKGTYVPAVIVLLTDGENNEAPDPIAAAQTAADGGVRIYTVGIGSTAGTILHINGIIVHTRLDEATLQQISQITGGTYYNAQSTQDLRNIYDNLDPQLTIKPEKTEVTFLFAGGSILTLLLGGLYSLLRFGHLP